MAALDWTSQLLDRDKETTFAPLLPGTTRKDMWKGMLAFDRPTWIRSLNKKTTFFITGQWFLHHIMHNEDTLTTALDGLIHEPEAARRLGEAGRARVARGCSWDDCFATIAGRLDLLTRRDRRPDRADAHAPLGGRPVGSRALAGRSQVR